MRLVTNGMSASITTAAPARSGTREIPVRSDRLTPSAWSGLSTGVHASSASSARDRSASWPTTTSTGSRPAPMARRTVRLSSDSPSSSKNSLLRPMRVELPAASTTPATAPLRSDG